MSNSARPGIPKARTGIDGLDDITLGGLPRSRPTIICGHAGCGKTLLALEFLVRGATQFNEPGVFVAFEENIQELTDNVRSLGFDLEKLIAEKKLIVDFVRVERSEIEETGEYDLEGLFVRLGYAVEKIGAKRVVLDTLESLFSGFSNSAILRSEFRRLFRWLKEKELTSIITAERGESSLTRQGLEEYVSDCVIFLDHRVNEQLSTRRLRIVKYRGTSHGTNEFPFLIDEDGISVLPITSAKLDHNASTERVSSGITELDAMLDGKGYYRGSSILLSGTAGTGKTTLSAAFAVAWCARGERCLFFAFEESPKQIVRNMRSVGIDLQPWVDKGLLQIHSSRPSLHGLEQHLTLVHKYIRDFEPQAAIIDPISNFATIGSALQSESMFIRLIDFLKSREITALMTALIPEKDRNEDSISGVSSLIDTWILIRGVETNNERKREIYLRKSRGMNHSNKVHEFMISSKGIQITQD